MPAKPPVAWYEAHPNNYTRANRPRSNNITRIVIHVTEGSFSSAVNWFANPNAGVSAHYVIRSRDGFIAQCVSDLNIAYHAGNWSINQSAIGIEHEAYSNNPSWYTNALYNRSARLVAHLCGRYNIPINRNRIIGHNEVVATTCPGQYWWWAEFMKRVRSFS